MKKIIKILAVVAALIVILVIAGVFLVMAGADKLAKLAIEEGGTYALGVETTVAKADVQLTAQAFEMEGLLVANPEGFDSHFLSLGNAGVTYDLSSIQSNIIEIPTLTINNLDMNLLKNDNGSNYKIILENLKKFESDEADPPPTSDPAEPGTDLIIREVNIQNVSVRMELTPLGGTVIPLDVDVDEIKLTDLGTKEPIAAGDLVSIIVKAVISAAINKGGDLIPGDMAGELQNGLAGLQSLGDAGVTVMMDVGGQLQNVGNDLGGAAKNIGDNAGKAIDDVGKGIGDVLKNPFGKKDKDDDDGG